jgi:hypothetical protein
MHFLSLVASSCGAGPMTVERYGMVDCPVQYTKAGLDLLVSVSKTTGPRRGKGLSQVGKQHMLTSRYDAGGGLCHTQA